MNRKLDFIKKLITVSLVVTVIVVFVFGGEINLQNIFIKFIYSLVFAALNMLYFIKMDKWIGWKNNPRKTLWISLAGLIPLNIVIFYILNFLTSYFVAHQSWEEAIKPGSYFSYIFVIVFSLNIALFILMLVFFKMVTDEKLKNEKLKTETEKSKFDSLKAQLNPHFLFNNLNVLTALIHESPEKAEQFTIELSDIYRYVLTTEEKELISLEEELNFAHKYLNLLKIRFENKIEFKFPKKIPPNKKIPPLSLQLLLENALKHNIFSEDSPLSLHIHIENDYLIIRNNLRKRQSTSSSQKGLNNLMERYRLLTKRPVLISEKDELFTVKIPLL